MLAWHEQLDQPLHVNGHDSMAGFYLGSRYRDTDNKAQLNQRNTVEVWLEDPELMECLSMTPTGREGGRPV